MEYGVKRCLCEKFAYMTLGTESYLVCGRQLERYQANPLKANYAFRFTLGSIRLSSLGIPDVAEIIKPGVTRQAKSETSIWELHHTPYSDGMLSQLIRSSGKQPILENITMWRRVQERIIIWEDHASHFWSHAHCHGCI